jgi:type IV pilus assembly protein PilQ
MMSRHTIRVMAVVVACALAAAWARAQQRSDTEPAAREVRPSPDVVHTPEGVRIRRGAGDEIEVSRFDTVSLRVDQMDLLDALELLAAQSQRNIIPSPKVSGRVTANLYDVTFYEALDAILQQNAAGYIERGNFIYVYTLDELRQIREAERRAVHRVFRLNYLNAQDAATFVTPLLSSQGKIVAMRGVEEGFQPDLIKGGANSNALGEVLLVRDFEENVADVARLLYELDTPPAQVLIEATVLRANLVEDLALGVDMSILFDLDQAAMGAAGTGPFGAIAGMLSGSVREQPSGAVNSTVGDVTSERAGVRVGVLTNNVAVFIRALDQVTDTTVLANPKVMTLNRQRAEVLVGRKVGYVSTTATATATTQTIEYLDTGTKLTLRPFVSVDGSIRLELRPSISSATIRRETGVAIPDEDTQELTTNVMVRDGQTVVLGGLFQEQTTVTRNQVPGLGDLPIAGWAFRGKDDTVDRSEVIFLITPHIVTDRAMAAASDSVLEDIDRMREGARQKLLPWSRSRWSSGHLRDALEHLEDGESDKALWHVNKALSFDPLMPEARRLKERLTGERVYQPSRSLLEEAVDMAVDDQAGRRPRTRAHITPDPAPALPGRPEGYDPAAARYIPPPPQAPPPPPQEDGEQPQEAAPPPPAAPPGPPVEIPPPAAEPVDEDLDK